MNEINKKLMTRWVKALRSGKYEQGKDMLYNHITGKYCCLGVLRNIEPRIASQRSELEFTTLTTYAGPGIDQYHLIKMNDAEDKSFSEIADFIEQTYINN